MIINKSDKRFSAVQGTCALFTLIVLFLPHQSYAQMQISKEPQEVIAVFDAMYRYNLPEAENKLKTLNPAVVGQDWVDLSKANLLWWWMISGDTTRNYDREMDEVLTRLINRYAEKPLHQLSNEQIFTMIHGYAYLTRVDIYREKYLKGIGNLRHTMTYLEIALNHEYEYDKFMMVSGLYNYFAAAAQAEYPIFTPFFAWAPDYNRAQGFSLLHRCSQMDDILVKNESLYYLMKIDYQLEKNYAGAMTIADDLIQRYPNNLIYHFHRFMILIESGNRALALKQYARLIEVSVKAPALNTLQRNHMIDTAKKRLMKEKINIAI